MLHGQTSAQLRHANKPNPTLIADRRRVEQAMPHLLPQLTRRLPNLLNDKSMLQRTGANAFFCCVGAAMEQCEIASAGLPKHDGWIFAATESQAEAVQQVFQTEAKRISGLPFPVTLEPLL